jgi:1-acyl-sn-glycerol-3-phosphate acyltransferase
MSSEKWKSESDLGNPGQVHPDSRRRWLKFGRPLIHHAFRPHIEGIENIPKQGPYMIVANHSGLGNAEIAVLVIFCLEHSDTIGSVAPMIHPLSYRGPQGPMMRRLGAIPSTYAAVEAAIKQGVSVLVMPGGDVEAMRPVWQANQVDFGGRKGFLKIAQKAQVPILPIGISGSHYTAPTLWRSERILPKLFILPALTGMKRYALTLLGVLGCALIFYIYPLNRLWLSILLSWLWLVLPLSTLPWIPWKIRVRIGELIPHQMLFPKGEASLDEAYALTVQTVQKLVAEK